MFFTTVDLGLILKKTVKLKEGLKLAGENRGIEQRTWRMISYHPPSYSRRQVRTYSRLFGLIRPVEKNLLVHFFTFVGPGKNLEDDAFIQGPAKSQLIEKYDVFPVHDVPPLRGSGRIRSGPLSLAHCRCLPILSTRYPKPLARIFHDIFSTQ